jgi:pyruvate formate lyase activating enzyme
MNIQGLQKVSLLDYPGKIACTVFTGGCNFRCPFCHNSLLVLPGNIAATNLTEDDFFKFLTARINKLDGVCISGGEPLIQPDLESFIRRIRSMGFAVKIDTNGSMPEQLKNLVNSGLIDYVAMDIKNSPEQYSVTVGQESPDLDKISQSVAFLLSDIVSYEFRTTIVKEFHTETDIEQIGQWIKGAKRYYLQEFVDSGSIIGKDLHAVSPDKANDFLRIASKYVPCVQLR